MRTWSPSSKKCSKAELLLASLLLWVPTGATAAPAPARPDSARLLKEIRQSRGTSFDTLIRRWESEFGSSAAEPLIGIAQNTRNADQERYVALMGAAKMGGQPAAPVVARFLKDRSWMIRSGALRALTVLNHAETSPQVLPLLDDPALVVRVEAVDAARRLKPPGAPLALAQAAQSKRNYHHGKAQWVPQRALIAITELRAKEVAFKLRPLLDYGTDPELQRLTVRALEILTGSVLKPQAALSEKVREWKIKLQ